MKISLILSAYTTLPLTNKFTTRQGDCSYSMPNLLYFKLNIGKWKLAFYVINNFK